MNCVRRCIALIRYPFPHREGGEGDRYVAKGKGTGGRSSGPWKGGPQRGKSGQQPFSPRTTKEATPRPPRRDRGGQPAADGQGGGARGPDTRGPRKAGAAGGFARAGRAQPGKPGPTQREGGKANKPWANRPAKE